VVYVTPRPLYLRERDSVPIVQVAGWNPAPFWMGMENLALSGFEPRTVQQIPTKLSQLLGLYKYHLELFSANISTVEKRKDNNTKTAPIRMTVYKQANHYGPTATSEISDVTSYICVN
jgi:hypothetical protein